MNWKNIEAKDKNKKMFPGFEVNGGCEMGYIRKNEDGLNIKWTHFIQVLGFFHDASTTYDYEQYPRVILEEVVHSKNGERYRN